MRDGRFFFYGFDTDIVEALISQDFDRLNTLFFEPKKETDVRVSAKIPLQLLEGADTEIKYDEDSVFEDRGKEENRKTIAMVGELVHTTAGRVLGYVWPVNR
jgi:hypothetical protein